ncbi:MAG: hypothetical protein BWY83_02774 [bacterium ADurb.Bin478]|nr:MAG: hypothetical protein BWY83_02774 [bacterium ADurb.Bin478]
MPSVGVIDARPLLLVVASAVVAPENLPPPEITVKRTLTLLTGVWRKSCSLTTRGADNGELTVPVW